MGQWSSVWYWLKADETFFFQTAVWGCFFLEPSKMEENKPDIYSSSKCRRMAGRRHRRANIRVCRVAWLGSDPVHPAILGCSKKIAMAVSGHCPKGICSYFCPTKRPSKTRTWGRSGLLFRSLAKRSLRSGAPPPTNRTRQLCCIRDA